MKLILVVFMVYTVQSLQGLAGMLPAKKDPAKSKHIKSMQNEEARDVYDHCVKVTKKHRFSINPTNMNAAGERDACISNMGAYFPTGAFNDCSDTTWNGPNGNRWGKGCSSARWSGGHWSEDYCINHDGRFPWFKQCCEWRGGKCVEIKDPKEYKSLLAKAFEANRADDVCRSSLNFGGTHCWSNSYGWIMSKYSKMFYGTSHDLKTRLRYCVKKCATGHPVPGTQQRFAFGGGLQKLSFCRGGCFGNLVGELLPEKRVSTYADMYKEKTKCRNDCKAMGLWQAWTEDWLLSLGDIGGQLEEELMLCEGPCMGAVMSKYSKYWYGVDKLEPTSAPNKSINRGPGDCASGTEYKMYDGKTDELGPVARAAKCETACNNYQWEVRHEVKGFTVRLNDGKCYCETDRGNTCRRNSGGGWQKYDFPGCHPNCVEDETRLAKTQLGKLLEMLQSEE